MNDMSAVIVAKSDQINADDLIAGPRVVTIADVKINAGTEQPVQMRLEGSDKFYRPCKTASRIIVALWGADASQYVGRSLRLYRDPNVTWAGVKVGGIRIDRASHITGEMQVVVKESQKVSKTHKIRPLVAEVTAIGLTIDDARALIAEAPDMEALRKVWLRKDMAPFRGELQADLDDRKAALAFEPEGKPDTDMGDQHDGTIDRQIDAYNAATSEAALATADKGARVLEIYDDPAVTAARDAAKGRLGL